MAFPNPAAPGEVRGETWAEDGGGGMSLLE